MADAEKMNTINPRGRRRTVCRGNEGAKGQGNKKKVGQRERRRESGSAWMVMDGVSECV